MIANLWLVVFLGIAFGVFIWISLLMLDLTYPAGGTRWNAGLIWLAVAVPFAYATGILFISEVVRVYQQFVC